MRKGKYLSWGNFLKTRREIRFKSAREFCSQVPIGISYPQYSRYEAGDQLPSLEQSLSMGAILGVPSMETLLEWSVAQVPAQDAITRAELSRFLEEVRGKNPSAWPTKVAERTVPLDDVIVFNRSHLRVFSSDPRTVIFLLTSIRLAPIGSARRKSERPWAWMCLAFGRCWLSSLI